MPLFFFAFSHSFSSIFFAMLDVQKDVQKMTTMIWYTRLRQRLQCKYNNNNQLCCCIGELRYMINRLVYFIKVPDRRWVQFISYSPASWFWVRMWWEHVYHLKSWTVPIHTKERPWTKNWDEEGTCPRKQSFAACRTEARHGIDFSSEVFKNGTTPTAVFQITQNKNNDPIKTKQCFTKFDVALITLLD